MEEAHSQYSATQGFARSVKMPTKTASKTVPVHVLATAAKPALKLTNSIRNIVATFSKFRSFTRRMKYAVNYQE